MDHHLLAKLWDDTLAGPVPDLGLGNYSTRPSSSSSSSSPRMRLSDVGKEGGGMGQQEPQRSIMTMRNNPTSESPPVSPAGSLSPCSEKEEETYRHPFGRRHRLRAKRSAQAGLEAAAGDHILLLTMSDQI